VKSENIEDKWLQADQGAVLLLLHAADNRNALRRLLNLAVDMKLPSTFTALLDELQRVDEIQKLGQAGSLP
jgi:hypothetical protein